MSEKDNSPFKISRRKTLAALGTIGAASAGAGLGTTAWFSDTETFQGNTISAGSLDLKVDWEEHYYDGSSGAEYLQYEEPEAGDFVAFPDPENSYAWVPREDLAAFMDATSIEAFPDPDGDNIQEVEYDDWVYNACEMGADTPEDLDPSPEGALRTENADTWDSENDEARPIIALDDVKPGDFGELTMSFHLCDNPGYVWLMGELVSAAENGHTEPEEQLRPDPEVGGPNTENTTGNHVELLDAIKTVWWYDARGDNVIQDCGVESVYLADSQAGEGTGTTLFEVTLDGGVADLTELYETSGDNFDQTDAIAATPNGDEIILFDKDTKHLGAYSISDDTFEDKGTVSGAPGGVVLAGHSLTGELWAASQDDDQLYMIDPEAGSMTAMGDTGIDLQGADLVFGSDGLYIWTSADGEEGLYKVANPTVDTTAVAVDGGNGFDGSLTGLAIMDSDAGHLLGSDRDNDEIVKIDRTDGSVVESYSMEVDGEAYNYDWGDMTAGLFCGEVFRRGNLRDDLAALSLGHGIPLDGNLATPIDEVAGIDNDEIETSADRDPFAPELNHYIGFTWYVPPEVGNEIQTDSVEFDIGFYTEQERHNSGAGLDLNETANNSS